MAQAGFTPLSLYYSTTAAAVPVNTNLANGELAINITDGKLYYKDNAGVVRVIASTAALTSVDSISFGTTGLTPATATTGVVTVAGTLNVANGGTGATTNTVARTNLGATTLGANIFTITNPSAVTFPRFNADNTISALDAATFRTAIGAGTGAGTVTSITAGTGLSGGTITTSGTIAIDSTVVTLTGTQTLTNKFIQPRVSSTTSITSPLAWNSDNFDLYAATAQASNFTISADAGTPVDGEKITFRITSDATPRVVTFTGGVSKGFKPLGVTLTASGSDFTYTLIASKTTYFGAIYNTTSARWEIVALAQEA
jgi:hypothetical protein